MQPRRLDLNEVVSNMTMMLGRILGEDIVLQLNYLHQPAYIRADGGMIEQVLLNLVVNARDAMPKGSQLAIKITTSKSRPKLSHVIIPNRAWRILFVSPCRTPVPASTRKLSGAFSNRSSPPRKSVKARVSDWPPSTESSTNMKAGLKSQRSRPRLDFPRLFANRP